SSGLPGSLPLAALPMVALVWLVPLRQALHARRRRDDVWVRLNERLNDRQPAFVLYFSAPRNAVSHATMWLPYLERIGRPFIVVLREAHSFRKIASATTAPVVVCPSVRMFEHVLTP